jgi:hypothetical protein
MVASSSGLPPVTAPKEPTVTTHFQADENAPIACTMPVGEMGGRMREFHHLFAARLRTIAREPRRLRLDLEATEGLEPTVLDLMAREHECCAFADIAVRSDPSSLTIDIGVPEGAEGALDGFAFIAETAAPGAAR